MNNREGFSPPQRCSTLFTQNLDVKIRENYDVSALKALALTKIVTDFSHFFNDFYTRGHDGTHDDNELTPDSALLALRPHT